MLFDNEFMIVPFQGHLRVFYDGEVIADVDTYEEGCKEIEEYKQNRSE